MGLCLLRRKCFNCKSNIYLDEKETYVIKNQSLLEKIMDNVIIIGIFGNIIETKFLCLICNRELKLKRIIKC